MSKRVAMYLRVSTTSQTVENQRLELDKYCERQGWTVSRFISHVGVYTAGNIFTGKIDFEIFFRKFSLNPLRVFHEPYPKVHCPCGRGVR